MAELLGDLIAWLLRKKGEKKEVKKVKREEKKREDEEERHYTTVYYTPYPKVKAYYFLNTLGHLFSDKEGVNVDLYKKYLENLKSHRYLYANKNFHEVLFRTWDREGGVPPDYVILKFMDRLSELPIENKDRLYWLMKKYQVGSSVFFEEDPKAEETLKKIIEHVEKNWKDYEQILHLIYDEEHVNRMSEDQKRRAVVGLVHDIYLHRRRYYFSQYGKTYQELMRLIEPFEDKVLEAVKDSRYMKALEDTVSRERSERLKEWVRRAKRNLEDKDEILRIFEDTYGNILTPDPRGIVPPEQIEHLAGDEKEWADYRRKDSVLSMMFYPYYIQKLEEAKHKYPEVRQKLVEEFGEEVEREHLWNIAKRELLHYKTTDGKLERYEHGALLQQLSEGYLNREKYKAMYREYLKDFEETLGKLEGMINKAKGGRILKMHHEMFMDELASAEHRKVRYKFKP